MPDKIISDLPHWKAVLAAMPIIGIIIWQFVRLFPELSRSVELRKSVSEHVWGQAKDTIEMMKNEISSLRERVGLIEDDKFRLKELLESESRKLEELGDKYLILKAHSEIVDERNAELVKENMALKQLLADNSG